MDSVKRVSGRKTHRLEHCSAGDVDVGNITKLPFRYVNQVVQIRPYGNVASREDDIARLFEEVNRFVGKSQISDNNPGVLTLGGELDEGQAYAYVEI